ncbi:MAG: cytochrome P450, partial [Myxococcales bacterium]
VLAVGPEPARLPLTLNAVHETTRLKPSADILLRYVESDLEAGPWTIPAGWVVFVSPGVAHQTALFKNPRAFEPDRFETEEHDRFAMIGFGAGIHKCAGMHFANNEMAIIAAMLFAQLDLQLVTKSPRQVLGLGAARPSRTVLRYRKRITSSRGTATRPSPSPALSATP